MMTTTTMTPQYNTILFNELFESAEDFVAAYNEIGLGGLTKTENVTKLFYLLYGKYGNNPLANKDLAQAQYKLFSIVFMYGPTWEKRLEIQSNLRNLNEDELRVGSKAVHNHAYNPSTSPSTQTLEELLHINDQNTTNYKKSKMDAYMQLWMLLDTDVTSDFLNKFKILFKQFVRPENPLIYVTEEDN